MFYKRKMMKKKNKIMQRPQETEYKTEKDNETSDWFSSLFILACYYVNYRATTAKLAKMSMRHEQ